MWGIIRTSRPPIRVGWGIWGFCGARARSGAGNRRVLRFGVVVCLRSSKDLTRRGRGKDGEHRERRGQEPERTFSHLRAIRMTALQKLVALTRRCGVGALDWWSQWCRWGCRLLRRLCRRALPVFPRADVFRRWRRVCRCRGRRPYCAAGRPRKARGGGGFPGLGKKGRWERADDTSRPGLRT